MKLSDLLTFFRNNPRDIEVEINPDLTLDDLAEVKSRAGAILMVDMYIFNTRQIGERAEVVDGKLTFSDKKRIAPYGKTLCR